MKTLVASIAVLLGGTIAAAACPDVTLYGDQTYQVTGKQLYQRQEWPVVAGGDNAISNCKSIRPRTDRGDGWVATPPDFSIELSGMGRYSLSIGARTDDPNCDPILLINTGSENWYYDDDDWGDGDAIIQLTRPSNGWLDIWVGTFGGNVCDAYLAMETFDR